MVAMARHGLILNDNEATGSGKVSKYLPGLWDTIKNSKMTTQVKKYKKYYNLQYLILIFLYISYFP